MDHSIFIMAIEINRQIVSTFADNIKIIVVKRSGNFEKVKQKLTTVFEIVDIDPISFYLRLKVERNRVKRILKLS